MDTVDIPPDCNLCLVCSCQIVLRGVHDPIQPHTTRAFNPSNLVAGTHVDRGDLAPLAHGKPDSDTIDEWTQDERLADGVATEVPIQVSSSRSIHHAFDCARPFRHRVATDRAATPFCSDRCRLADRRSCDSVMSPKCNTSWSMDRRLQSSPTNSVSATSGSGEDAADYLSKMSAEPHSSPASLGAACTTDAYSRLSVIYGFAPLPPAPPFVSRATTSSLEPVPSLEGGIIMAARRIQAALCIDKTKKTFWGIPIHNESEDDNKPIPGWTDGSNAWRASVYGLAPPRDFNRVDPDDAAIRAYGSCVAFPHRSRDVHSTPGNTKSEPEVQTTSSSSIPSSRADVSTQKLYRQYCSSASPTGSTRCSPREVPLLKPGAEGRLLVPDVKMRLPKSFPSVDSSSRRRDTLGVERLYCEPSQQKSDTRLNAYRTQSYESEAITYPIMRLPPKKEMRVERRIIDGVECEVEVEVMIEEPIKRLFLFGGAQD